MLILNSLLHLPTCFWLKKPLFICYLLHMLPLGRPFYSKIIGRVQTPYHCSVFRTPPHRFVYISQGCLRVESNLAGQVGKR